MPRRLPRQKLGLPNRTNTPYFSLRINSKERKRIKGLAQKDCDICRGEGFYDNLKIKGFVETRCSCTNRDNANERGDLVPVDELNAPDVTRKDVLNLLKGKL